MDQFQITIERLSRDANSGSITTELVLKQIVDEEKISVEKTIIFLNTPKRQRRSRAKGEKVS